MNLYTERLVLEEARMNDLDKIHALHILPETDRFNTSGIPSSVAETKKILLGWIELQNAEPQQKYSFMIHHKTSAEFIGIFGLRVGKSNYHSAEVSYKVHPSHWNNGYATEALMEVLRFCFNDLGMHRIDAGCAVENIASAKVLEKAGFTKEGRARKILPIRGTWSDNFSYAILEEDFNQKSA